MKIYEDIQKLYMSYMRRRFSPNYRTSAPRLRGYHPPYFAPPSPRGATTDHYWSAEGALLLRSASNIASRSEQYWSEREAILVGEAPSRGDHCIIRHSLRCLRHSGLVIYTSKLPSPSVLTPCDYRMLHGLTREEGEGDGADGRQTSSPTASLRKREAVGLMCGV